MRCSTRSRVSDLRGSLTAPRDVPGAGEYGSKDRKRRDGEIDRHRSRHRDPTRCAGAVAPDEEHPVLIGEHGAGRPPSSRGRTEHVGWARAGSRAASPVRLDLGAWSLAEYRGESRSGSSRIHTRSRTTTVRSSRSREFDTPWRAGATATVPWTRATCSAMLRAANCEWWRDTLTNTDAHREDPPALEAASAGYGCGRASRTPRHPSGLKGRYEAHHGADSRCCARRCSRRGRPLNSPPVLRQGVDMVASPSQPSEEIDSSPVEMKSAARRRRLRMEELALTRRRMLSRGPARGRLKTRQQAEFSGRWSGGSAREGGSKRVGALRRRSTTSRPATRSADATGDGVSDAVRSIPELEKDLATASRTSSARHHGQERRPDDVPST